MNVSKGTEIGTVRQFKTVEAMGGWIGPATRGRACIEQPLVLYLSGISPSMVTEEAIKRVLKRLKDDRVDGRPLWDTARLGIARQWGKPIPWYDAGIHVMLGTEPCA